MMYWWGHVWLWLMGSLCRWLLGAQTRMWWMSSWLLSAKQVMFEWPGHMPINLGHCAFICIYVTFLTTIFVAWHETSVSETSSFFGLFCSERFLKYYATLIKKRSKNYVSGTWAVLTLSLLRGNSHLLQTFSFINNKTVWNRTKLVVFLTHNLR